ncbi:MAG TPA: winged helix-turn-helix domain-containing protein [Thermomicrobiales bacterium]|nr:winged helix-turn-helix domain-containing protein [Thermomicrobiales bacterium]
MAVLQSVEPINRPKDPLAYLAELLSSRVRAQVITFLAVRSDTAYSLTEIARGLGLSISSVQHECYKLERLNVLIARPDRGSRRYQLNRGFATTEPLVSMVFSAFTPVHLLGLSLEDAVDDGSLISAALAGDPQAAAEAPLHLVLIGTLSLDQLASIQDRAPQLLGIPPESLEVAFFSRDQWDSHVAAGHEFVTRLLREPLLPIVGSLQ